MNNTYIVAAVVYFASYLISRKIGLDALNKLDDSVKLELLNTFGQRNFHISVGILAFVVIYFLLLSWFPAWYLFVAIGGIAFFFIYLIVKTLVNIRKLRGISAPESYIKSIGLCNLIFIVGMAVAIGIVVFDQ